MYLVCEATSLALSMPWVCLLGAALRLCRLLSVTLHKSHIHDNLLVQKHHFLFMPKRVHLCSLEIISEKNKSAGVRQMAVGSTYNVVDLGTITRTLPPQQHRDITRHGVVQDRSETCVLRNRL